MRLRRMPRALRLAAFTLVACALGLLVVEGLASVILFVRAERRWNPPARHSRYDPEVGWVNISGWSRANHFGPGRDLRINAQGYRAGREYPWAAPPGKLRVLAIGDSFTFGVNVGDEHTTGAELERIDPRLEVVNLGQEAYGADQAYLYYLREAPRLDHGLVLFSVIAEDFFRMESDHYRIYRKPRLALADGRLVPVGVPVPRAPSFLAYLSPWVTGNDVPLRVTTLLESLRREPPAADSADLRRTAAAMFDSLYASVAAHGRTLLVAYLPTAEEMENDPYADLRRWLAKIAAGRWTVVDLTSDFRALIPRERTSLFQAGHYSEAGYRFVAEKIDPVLREQVRSSR